MLRWLLPVVTILAMLVSSVTAFAASGVIGEASCCCPDPDTRKCHDHDGGPQPAYDTYKVRVEIPAGMTSVRPLFSDFGKPTVTKSGTPAQVTAIEWGKVPSDVLADDEGYYEITIRAKIPNAPFTQIPIVVHQICLVGGVEMTMSWNVLPPGTGNTAPVLTIVPHWLNPTGWNRFTIPAGVTVPAEKLGTFFADAQIQPLQVLELVEGTMTGGMGDTAVITLSAPTADMGWNIHGHANSGTQIIFEEHDKMDVAYTFSPTAQAEWYLLVRNEGQANMEVMMRVELFGSMAWAWL